MEVTPPSAIQLLLGDDRAFAVRSTTIVGAIGHLRRLESDSTSTGGRSDFCRQIHHPGKSDRTPSLFGEVTLSSTIQLLLEDDRTFTVRSTVSVGAIGCLRCLERRLRLQRSNFYWGTIRLLSSDPSPWGRSDFYRQIHRSGRSDQALSSFGEVTQSSVIQRLLGDDRAFIVKSTASVGAIGRLRRLKRGDSAVSNSTSTGRRSDFCCQIYRPGRSDRMPSLFREMEAKPYPRRLLGEAKAKMHHRRPLKATTY
ncbi:hypothetical protein E5676_scaffold174G00060 [Cucumis melo var. makuwa]|uniref:Uncharacterized protein n=1 Tax=Cucumis melo var. makuwa TaxID=1194695 RepID=A0A5D3BFA9_CUCMM|nr:hypothetical protein E6C27_scaffold485G001010 [Cucumis melo var. makuwa]TYJ97135.1 hypothetical protein E5676_scaffold174G00060 [Cucumis melo var. makuwa]